MKKKNTLTQLELARQGVVSDKMKQAALAENIDPELLRQRIAAQSAEVAAGVRILYGGSMKPDNAQELMSQADIDGGLIGGASLKAADFLAICQAGDDNA